MVGSATVTLVDPHDIHTCSQAFLRNAAHVAGVTGAFKAMNDDQGEGLTAVRLPVTLAENADSGRNLEIAVFGKG